MKKLEPSRDPCRRPHCCPVEDAVSSKPNLLSRRTFLKGMGTTALGSMALNRLSWTALSEAGTEDFTIRRIPLRVKPILVYSTPKRRPQTSWRSWGAIQTEEDASREAARIEDELDGLRRTADFPVEFLPLARVRGAAELSGVNDISTSDALLVYPAGGWLDVFRELEKAGKN